MNNKNISGLKVKRGEEENHFQRDLQMTDDSCHVRIQDIGPAKRQEILEEAKTQLSSDKSFYFLMMPLHRREKGAAKGL